ncbi:GerAB/ArcD/ProY family transporter [Brevibacillus agri]|uniref:GerAB/ArcD/ProY family transporter n=1 Tax=Brevibacillus TaxID=55080 RepID=UPI000271CC40|nr:MULTISPECIES: endospore germination permease [Brevibacillus]EJL44113.1 spore germination protein, amino acid permease [Brevibacillus sp. CF112]MBG9564499.1 spore gernimation protein [Brevibacillus agri]MCG5253983.1 spore germination protein [Brevibacillus agri]MDR9506063.1 endospore germination permease [Brevibacillus agri]
MLETGKISALQMGMMMYPVLVSTAMLVGPSIMAQHAQNDLWLTPLWASLIGFFSVWIAIHLNKRFPGMSVIEHAREITGKVPAAVLGFLYLYFLLQVNGIIVREYADFIALFLQETPLGVISSALIFVCSLAVKGGIEVLGRTAQVFFPVFILPLLIMIGLVFPALDPGNLFPILDNGVLPSMKGAVTPLGWFTEVFLISYLLPFLSNCRQGARSAFFVVAGAMLTMTIANLVTLFLMGDALGNILFPIMDTAKYVNVADFFENMESAVMAIWVIGAFVKVSMFYYATVLGTAQWLNLTTYQPLILPSGVLTVIFSFWGIPSFSMLGDVTTFAIPALLTLFFCFIPAGLLVWAIMRGKRSKTEEAESG